MRDQRGFTLIELMIAVAVVAVLALIAIPLFTGESRKGKAKTEIGPMFAEISSKEEAYKIDNNVYYPLTACPASPSASLQSAASCTTTWATARIALPQQEVRCSYSVTIGASNTTPDLSGLPAAAAAFTFNPSGVQAMPYYFIFATCDMDGSSTTNSYYFQGSGDSVLQVLNEGK